MLKLLLLDQYLQLSLAKVSPQILDIFVLLGELLINLLELNVTLWYLSGLHSALGTKIGCFQIYVLGRGHHMTGYGVIIVHLAMKCAAVKIRSRHRRILQRLVATRGIHLRYLACLLRKARPCYMVLLFLFVYIFVDFSGVTGHT